MPRAEVDEKNDSLWLQKRDFSRMMEDVFDEILYVW